MNTVQLKIMFRDIYEHHTCIDNQEKFSICFHLHQLDDWLGKVAPSICTHQQLLSNFYTKQQFLVSPLSFTQQAYILFFLLFSGCMFLYNKHEFFKTCIIVNEKSRVIKVIPDCSMMDYPRQHSQNLHTVCHKQVKVHITLLLGPVSSDAHSYCGLHNRKEFTEV